MFLIWHKSIMEISSIIILSPPVLHKFEFYNILLAFWYSNGYLTGPAVKITILVAKGPLKPSGYPFGLAKNIFGPETYHILLWPIDTII